MVNFGYPYNDIVICKQGLRLTFFPLASRASENSVWLARNSIH